jgi:hypothetical protein
MLKPEEQTQEFKRRNVKGVVRTMQISMYYYIPDKRSSMSNLNSKIEVETTANLVTKVYEKLQNKISTMRKATDRPLTISEKILVGHLDESVDFSSDDALIAGKSYVLFNPDRDLIHLTWQDLFQRW